jgi:hypothetical protein
MPDLNSACDIRRASAEDAGRIGANRACRIHQVHSTPIAEGVNARGIPTARGGRWQAMTVSNVLARA